MVYIEVYLDGELFTDLFCKDLSILRTIHYIFISILIDGAFLQSDIESS